MATKCISELNMTEIKRELSNRGMETGGTKADILLRLEEYIRTYEKVDPTSVLFEVMNLLLNPTPENSESNQVELEEAFPDED